MDIKAMECRAQLIGIIVSNAQTMHRVGGPKPLPNVRENYADTTDVVVVAVLVESASIHTPNAHCSH